MTTHEANEKKTTWKQVGEIGTQASHKPPSPRPGLAAHSKEETQNPELLLEE